MVTARSAASGLTLVALAFAPAAAAQPWKRDLGDCGLTPCVLFDAGPSLSKVQLEFSAGDQNPNLKTGEALDWKAQLRLTQPFVRRQNIWHNSRRKLAECEPRLGLGFRRRACGVASADARWSVA
jgi:hypothetical protein